MFITKLISRNFLKKIYQKLNFSNFHTVVFFTDMKPGPPHGENEVTREDDLNPPFLITATKLKGFVRSKCTV